MSRPKLGRPTKKAKDKKTALIFSVTAKNKAALKKKYKPIIDADDKAMG